MDFLKLSPLWTTFEISLEIQLNDFFAKLKDVGRGLLNPPPPPLWDKVINNTHTHTQVLVLNIKSYTYTSHTKGGTIDVILIDLCSGR